MSTPAGLPSTSNRANWDAVRSFVPLGTGSKILHDVQSYPDGTSAVVSAAISSFGGNPNVAAVDSALVRLENITFSGLSPSKVLVLDANVAAAGGALHRISYQVTVLVRSKEASTQPPSAPPSVLRERDKGVLSLNNDAHLFL